MIKKSAVLVFLRKKNQKKTVFFGKIFFFLCKTGMLQQSYGAYTMYNLILLILLISATIGIALWGMRKTTPYRPFPFRDQAQNPWLSAASYELSYCTIIFVTAFAGTIGWGSGYYSVIIAGTSGIFGAGLAWIFLARRTRLMMNNFNVTALPGFLEKRYESTHIKKQASLTLFIFLVPYAAAIIRGLTWLFQITLQISFLKAFIFVLILVLFWIVLSDYFTISGSQSVLAALFITGFLIVTAILIIRCRGTLHQINRFYLYTAARTAAPASVITIISSGVITSIGMWALPHTTQQFIRYHEHETIVKIAGITTISVAVTGIVLYSGGILSHVFHPATNNHEQLIPHLLADQLPVTLLAILLLLITATSVPVCTSLVRIFSTNHHLPDDPDQPVFSFINKKELVFLILSATIAAITPVSLLTLTALSWGTISGAFLAPYVLGLWCTFITKAGMYAGFYSALCIQLAGTIVTKGEQAPAISTLALLIPFIITPLVSLFTRRVSPQTIQTAFSDTDAVP
jgi:solute:Na+ symporter, SSS family